jgi:Kef-type K+ transport system membrane component KefB/Trk K+ transport system NAD-binding subunit
MYGDGVLVDIGIAIITATALAYLARRLRQPLLLAYIGAGLLIGPHSLGIVHNDRLIADLSELGLAFLMFIVGLEIDVKKLVSSGRVVAPVAIGQVSLCTLLSFGIVRLLGFQGLPAFYLAVTSAFSSTMIVVKLLADKSELDTVEGRLTLGILLVQDALAIVVLALQPNLTHPSLTPICVSLVAGVGLVVGALAVARFGLPPILRWAAKSPEIVLLSAISWCMLVGYLAVQANFSIAMGALIAGVTLSALPYTLDVIAKIRDLRDFFVTLFFVALGMQLELGAPRVLLAAAVLSTIVVASRFVTVAPMLSVAGYGLRIGVLSSLALTPVSEFAIVIVSIGLALGQIDREVTSVMALTLVITATVSTYLVTANHRIARRVTAAFARVGLRVRGSVTDPAQIAIKPELVILGFHRVASSLMRALGYSIDGPRLLIVDFSPEVYETLNASEVPVVYGDISNLDTLEDVGIEHARIVLSTVSDDFLRGTDNITILRTVRRLNPAACVIVCAETGEQARRMYAAGANFVVLPRMETARAFMDVLKAIERGTLDALRMRALAELAANEVEVLV